VTATIISFDAQLAPCKKLHGGVRSVTEDQYGLVTEDVRFSCGCSTTREEFHDGSVHRMVVDHRGRVLVDEELRGE
jgi:hypothetical protein